MDLRDLPRARSARLPSVNAFDVGHSGPFVAWRSAATAVARGRAAYEDGRLDEALAEFEAAIRLAPNAAVPRLQRGRRIVPDGSIRGGPPTVSRGSPARRFLLADQDRLRAGQHGPGPRRHPGCDRCLRRRASPRPPAAPGWTASGRTPRSTATSPTSRPNPLRFRKDRAPTIPRPRVGRTGRKSPRQTRRRRPVLRRRAGERSLGRRNESRR